MSGVRRTLDGVLDAAAHPVFWAGRAEYPVRGSGMPNDDLRRRKLSQTGVGELFFRDVNDVPKHDQTCKKWKNVNYFSFPVRVSRKGRTKSRKT